MTIFRLVREYFCKHEFKKYYDKNLETYIGKCVKCGKKIYRRFR